MDLHRLWDRGGLLAVHESSLEVLLAPKLATADYGGAALGGTTMRRPEDPAKFPSTAALEQQRRWAGL